jgi:hypothetical protein
MNKSLIKVFQIYIFVYAFLFASRPMGDADFWFHLKTGEYIFSTGAVPRTEMWSATFHGVPWLAHGWLAGVSFYAVFSWMGLKALIFIFAVLTAIAFWIAFKRANSHPFIAGFATLVAVWTSLPNIGVRPRVFTILLASIYLALLGRFARGIREWWIWILIPLMALWANLHGGFFIGLGLIVLTAVGMVIDYWAGVLAKPASLRKHLRKLAVIFVGCVLAGLLNPYGINLYLAALRVLRSSVFLDLVVDFLSPDFHLPTTRPLLLLILATIAVLALSPKRPKPSEVLLFVATLYSTLKIQRNAILLALVAAPLFSDYFQLWIDSTQFGKYFAVARADGSQRLAILVSVLFLLPLIPFGIKLKDTVYATPTQQSLRVPVQAVEYLKQNGITGNTFTVPNIWGGYVLWASPGNPVYIDGRDVYPESFVKEFVDVIYGRIDWRIPFDRTGVKIALVEPDTMLARELGEAAGWEKIYQDEMSVMFRRR